MSETHLGIRTMRGQEFKLLYLAERRLSGTPRDRIMAGRQWRHFCRIIAIIQFIHRCTIIARSIYNHGVYAVHVPVRPTRCSIHTDTCATCSPHLRGRIALRASSLLAVARCMCPSIKHANHKPETTLASFRAFSFR